MKIWKLLTLLVLFAVLTVTALARTVHVKMQYTTGSHGQYGCYLFRNGAPFLCKAMTNNGFGGGYADFTNVPTGNYVAYVFSATDGRRAWTNTKTLWWWMSSVTLTGRI